MNEVKKIDIHAHAIAWPQYYPAYYGTESKKLSPTELFDEYYNALGVEKCVLLPGTSPEGATTIAPGQKG